MDKILTVDDVAAILKVKPITVREMFRGKRLRAFKIGKAWRTTEAMLQEDLAGMAAADIDGEEDIIIAPPVVESPQPSSENKAKTKTPRPKKKAPEVVPEPEDEEETTNPQQMLF